tara:strand:+ start:211 stop:906 length:696 start_codon:yes stop_codon:yes gene_type:complete
MSFLKEKLEIYADKTIFTVDEMEECFQRIPKNLPEYFKYIPKKIFSEEMQTEDMSKNTIKSCAGFINLFKRSILFCSPFDMQFSFKGDKMHFRLGSFPVDVSQFIDIHPAEQFLQYAPENMKNNVRCVMRLKTNMYYKSSVPMLLHHPFWHVPKLVASPGLLTKNKELNLNIFFFISNNQENFIIKKGDPLVYITFLTEKKVKFKYKTIEKKQSLLLKTFSRLKKYTMNML